MKEQEDSFASREKNYEAQIDELTQSEEKFKKKASDLTEQLEKATFDRENYKAQLSGNDGRMEAMETQLVRLENAKNDAEFRLTGVYSVLRRMLGVRSRSRSPTPSDGSPTKPRMTFRNRRRSNSGKNQVERFGVRNRSVCYICPLP